MRFSQARIYQILLNFALGFHGGANFEKITLQKLDLESSSIVRIITNDTSYNLENVLAVNVYPYLNDDSASIYVEGAIREPGYYNLEDYENLEQLINDLDFLNVYPWLAYLEQFDENNLVKISTLFSLKDPDTYKSIKLLPNSKVFFCQYKYKRLFWCSKNDFGFDR